MLVSSCRPPLVYQLTNLGLVAGQGVNTALLNGGQALRVGSTVQGKQLQYDLRISRGVSADGLKNALSYRGIRALGGGQLLVPNRLPSFNFNLPGGRKKSK